MATVNTNQAAASLEQIQAQLADVLKRLEVLEKAGAVKIAAAPPAAAPVKPVAAAPAAPAPLVLTDEELLAISAAVGAYMGVRAHIRQIRLLSTTAWAQQGRVSIQASHTF